jgi:8-oxo-dGTP pyrophosphatase MutT (NUDIX family)
VFRHAKYLEAGIQVPAGTLRENEDLIQGVVREVSEESG